MPIGMTLITNLTIFCIIVAVIIRKGLELGNYSGKANIFTLVFKEMYILVRNVIKNNTSLKRYQYFSTLFFLFLFILAANMIGLIPYSFTITSSFVITFFLALSHFIGINIIAVFKNK
jgi:F0F1-type ATP synthase membrane subunit a